MAGHEWSYDEVRELIWDAWERERFESREIDWDEYYRRYLAILAEAGWTHEEYFSMVSVYVTGS